MTSADRRRELRAQYEQRPREVGVYALRNTVTGRILVASSPDVGSVSNRLEFARATNAPSALDGRLTAEVRQFGMDAFVLEVLDLLKVTPEMTPADVQADLRALEELWREKLADTPQY
ncbi:MAG: GIY-YIG nuclease family protein [Candidatus Limnocylindrales bacterium]